METTNRKTGRTQRAFGLLILILTFSAATALAQEASVIYLEGEPELRASGGATEWLDFGTVLTPGDSVVTGRNDFVELEQGAASTIRVNPDTVFTIREVEENGRRRQVMSNSTGSVGYRFNRLAGRDEPRIGTTSVVAGIRGTEVVVYAGANGSSLFLVESGLVDVTSAGQTVSLAQDEGVEVPASGPPGDVFEWVGQELDFSTWNAQKLDEYLANPVAGVQSLMTQLDEFIEGTQEYRELYQEIKTEYDAKYETFVELEDGEEKDALREELQQIGNRQRTQVLNYRYYALSGLSLRRYVLGKMYIELTTRYILDKDNATYQGFIAEYERFLAAYNDGIVPRLVEADI
ncbi:MAG: FecR domain-containing protein [Spirochaeta sp.]|jgi:hypothetical protein|nr:FecR domain-containing protein [Spirochaeta sp.]